MKRENGKLFTVCRFPQVQKGGGKGMIRKFYIDFLQRFFRMINTSMHPAVISERSGWLL